MFVEKLSTLQLQIVVFAIVYRFVHIRLLTLERAWGPFHVPKVMLFGPASR